MYVCACACACVCMLYMHAVDIPSSVSFVLPDDLLMSDHHMFFVVSIPLLGSMGKSWFWDRTIIIIRSKEADIFFL